MEVAAEGAGLGRGVGEALRCWGAIAWAVAVLCGRADRWGAGRARTYPRVIDGDTLAIDTGTRVRLFGIDAPERGQPCRDGGDCGAARRRRIL